DRPGSTSANCRSTPLALIEGSVRTKGWAQLLRIERVCVTRSGNGDPGSVYCAGSTMIVGWATTQTGTVKTGVSEVEVFIVIWPKRFPAPSGGRRVTTSSYSCPGCTV